ncbi:hypothetical protein TGPRC2_215970 [Toxoplasma gondii TgCatPRC2]|uniref:Uncharacterized protein n=12 Tax=Toxoplasma gondii TaxID=5811 RepID=B9Q0L7_TOXGV|nr:hypothetical protein TGME49_215970 [Toxoplasma gondii ME49]EPR58625.1 hypothetical protein TGGT1_215970 [Toxoplasma gondii GT1]ESS28664.1 hypothetical protein TGVEG_215970 [Toxoplasma gondii VEG]KAF4639889.1 hypothetical protein TGRH88_056610 [Toxoplasma gondii]KFG30232.1 hypothetical protein TGDOM2_215970 [Toxoplasma gondii GAB2-2007-GAL-DOM2]KFG31811.1 hypothetical protein TGP89_215970 [Toxoplasma gondii p89]KFG40785.1 hypothetical protein TGFOU_215970 [Toxoplasma gondii FOU]KFH06560.1 |eukprot:XP_002370907.1 hypothetical protein TGME49_215970 [Toxoplasma gondii ME49]
MCLEISSFMACQKMPSFMIRNWEQLQLRQYPFSPINRGINKKQRAGEMVESICSISGILGVFHFQFQPCNVSGETVRGTHAFRGLYPASKERRCITLKRYTEFTSFNHRRLSLEGQGTSHNTCLCVQIGFLSRTSLRCMRVDSMERYVDVDSSATSSTTFVL